MDEIRRHAKTRKPVEIGESQPRELRKADVGRQLLALGEVNGYRIRPGFYNINGATMLTDGVNFTAYSNGATSITLLLYKRGEIKPFVQIPFPESYRIGKVYSMIVFDLDIETLDIMQSTSDEEKKKAYIALIRDALKLFEAGIEMLGFTAPEHM